MPLCSACAEHVTFSRPDVVHKVKIIKQQSLDYAVSNPTKFSESYINLLRNHLEWYERQVETASVTDAHGGVPFPLPWADEAVSHPDFFEFEDIPIWNRHHQRTYEQVRSSPDCEICIVFLSMIEYETTKRHIPVESGAQIATSWVVSRPSCRPQTLYAHVHFGDLKSAHFSISTQFGAGTAGKIPSPPRVPQGASTEDQSCRDFLVKTFSDCLLTHPRCASVHSDVWVPTRLLDVSPSPQNTPDSVVLVERDDIQKLPGQNGLRYFTLSHVWGNSIPAKLTLDNYSDRKRCISLDELPICFRDAVKMTRDLGGKYLWIDALCIIQDSPHDWASEAASMDKVYANGVCNLAASDTTNSNDSLFSHRKYPQSGSTIIHQEEFITVASTEKVLFILIPNWPDAIWSSCKLYSRAWVMQEQFFSQRIIHFSQFPVWECRTHLIMEGFAPEASHENCTFPTHTRGWLTAHPKGDNIPDREGLIYLRWRRIVALYTERDLTYRTDKLVALSGMAKAISTLLGEQQPYYAGIWGGKKFFKFLLWCSSKAKSCDSFEDKEYIAPSWSWACTIGPIYPCASYTTMRTLAEIISCYVIPKGDDIFGQVTAGGELVLRGTLFRVHDTDERSGWEAINGYLDSRPSNKNTGNSPIYFFPILETRDTTSEEGEGRTKPRNFAGLFLKLIEGHPYNGNAKFERVGASSRPLGFYAAKVLNREQLDMLEALPPFEPGKGLGDLVTII